MENWIDILHQFIVAVQTGQLPQLGVWTYFLLAGLVAVEGPLATLLGASAASAGLMQPGFVFIAAVAGNLTADLLWYAIGYMGRIEWLFRFSRRLGVRRELLEKLRVNIHEHAVKVLFIAKLTVTFVIPSLITAGLMRLPLKRWLPAFVAAETIWTGTLVLIGFYTVQAIQRVERSLDYVLLVVSVGVVIFLILRGRRLVKQWDHEINGTTPNKD